MSKAQWFGWGVTAGIWVAVGVLHLYDWLVIHGLSEQSKPALGDEPNSLRK